MAKKVITFMLLYVMFLGQLGAIVRPIYAQEEKTVSDMTEEELDAILLSRGASEIFLARIPVSEKNMLVECGAEGFETRSETLVVQEPSENGINQYGTISDTEMDFDITTSYILLGTPNARVFVYITYEWKDMPLWRLTDYLSITWDNNIFIMMNDTNLLVDYLTISDSYKDSVTHYEMNAVSLDSIIWEIDIRCEGAYEMKSGYAGVSLNIKSGIDHNSISTSFVANYVHTTIVPTVGISINTSGAGVSLSTSSYTYRKGIQKQFTTY